MKLLLTSFLLLTTPAMGSEWRLLEVDRLVFEYERLDPHNRHPYAPEYTGTWRERANLLWDVSILKYGFWDNTVSTSTTDPSGQVKLVHWEWRLGLRLGKYLDVFHYHRSEHLQDEAPEKRFDKSTRSQFPVDNSLVLRVKLYEKDR